MKKFILGEMKKHNKDKVAFEIIGQANIVKTIENYVEYLFVNCDG